MKEKQKRKVSIGEFMSGPGGQRFFNVAYSVGAAVVILGALFKILHVKGGDTLLAVGMGTEVLMFILTAFERPYYERDSHQSAHNPAPAQGPVVMAPGEEFPEAAIYADSSDFHRPAHPSPEVGVIVGQPVSQPVSRPIEPVIYQPVSNEADTDSDFAGSPLVVPQPVALPPELAENLSQSIKAVEENMQGYISRMEELNRNIAGLNTIYELQLKSASQQLSSIEYAGKSMTRMQNIYEGSAEKSQQFQEEADKLTENMKKLNEVYENMLRAMNVQNKA